MAPVFPDSLLGAVNDIVENLTMNCTAQRMMDMEQKGEEWRERIENLGELMVICGMGALMVAFVVGNLLHKVSWIPESIIVIAVGAVLGVGLQFLTAYDLTIHYESFVNKMVLNLILLPIIIFESGWSLRKRDFASQLGYILIFAVVGTLISMGVVGGLILLTSDLHGVREPRTAFAYAVLISAVDPVATLATYAHLNVEPFLNIMVFGESVINDAVAIAVFRVLNDPGLSPKETIGHTAMHVGYKMAELLFGSILLGLGLGCIYIMVLRFARMSHSPTLAILFVFLSAFFSYTFAEVVCGMSGIITVLFGGMIMSGYASPHLGVQNKFLCSFLLKQMASLADMTVFLFVGVASMFVSKAGLIFGCWVMLFCLVGRFCSTVPLAIASNGIKSWVGRHVPAERQNRISPQHMFMMWHAGLRGGIALILTLDLGPWVARIEKDEERGQDTVEILRNATLVVICVFLLVFGGTTEIFLKACGIRIGDQVPDTEKLFPKHTIKGPFWRFMRGFNKRLLAPILVGDREEAMRHTRSGGGDVVAQVLPEFVHTDPAHDGAQGDDRPRHRVSHTEALYELTGIANRSSFFEGLFTPSSAADIRAEDSDAASGTEQSDPDASEESED